MSKLIGAVRLPATNKAAPVAEAAREAAHIARGFAALSVAAYAFTVPFQRSFQIGGIGSPATLAAAITMIPVAIAMFGPLHHRFPRFLLMQAALTTIVVLQLGAARLPTQTADPYLRGLGPDIALGAIQLLVITWVVWEFLDSRQYLVITATAYVLGCYVALGDSIANIGSLEAVGYIRITGSDAAQPNVQALVFALGVPLAWYAYNYARHPFIRVAMLGYAPGALAAVLLTGSRSGLVGLVLACGCVALSFRAAPVPLKAAIIVLLIASVPLVPSLLPEESVERSVSTLEDEETTDTDLSTRQELWQIGLDVAAEHPWFGAGQGAVRERVFDTTIGSTELSSHNSVINIAAEYGFPAAGLFVAIYLAIGRAALYARWIERSVALGLLVPNFVILQVVNWEWEKANWLALTLAAAISTRWARDRRDAVIA